MLQNFIHEKTKTGRMLHTPNGVLMILTSWY